MITQQLQTLLATLYDVPADHAVADFLLTDRDAWSAPCVSDADEQVLLMETNDGLEVSVYIDAAVLERLRQQDPFAALSDGNLSDFCTALEGVSHFQYLCWRAAQAQPVSLLELELQAEVDKYAASVWLLAAQHGEVPRALHQQLFHRVRYCSGLSSEALARYRLANRGAAKFCRELEDRFLCCRRVRPEAWLKEMRRFYRLTHASKLRRAIA